MKSGTQGVVGAAVGLVTSVLVCACVFVWAGAATRARILAGLSFSSLTLLCVFLVLCAVPQIPFSVAGSTLLATWVWVTLVSFGVSVFLLRT